MISKITNRRIYKSENWYRRSWGHTFTGISNLFKHVHNLEGFKQKIGTRT